MSWVEGISFPKSQPKDIKSTALGDHFIGGKNERKLSLSLSLLLPFLFHFSSSLFSFLFLASSFHPPSSCHIPARRALSVQMKPTHATMKGVGGPTRLPGIVDDASPTISSTVFVHKYDSGRVDKPLAVSSPFLAFSGSTRSEGDKLNKDSRERESTKEYGRQAKEEKIKNTLQIAGCDGVMYLRCNVASHLRASLRLPFARIIIFVFI